MGPKRWLASLIALISPPLGMLYIVRPVAACAYLLATVAVAIAVFLFPAIRITRYLPALIAIFAAIHAWRVSPSVSFSRGRPWYSKWYGLTVIASLCAISIFAFRSFVIEPFRMPSVSMEPTIPIGSYIFVNKIGFGNYGSYGFRFPTMNRSASIRRGDLVVFDAPSQPGAQFIMRVVAIEGDRLEHKNHQLTVGGLNALQKSVVASDGRELVTESFGGIEYRALVDRSMPSRDAEESIAQGYVYVMGDNRSNSYDSRYWGPLSVDRIIGRVSGISKP